MTDRDSKRQGGREGGRERQRQTETESQSDRKRERERGREGERERERGREREGETERKRHRDREGQTDSGRERESGSVEEARVSEPNCCKRLPMCMRRGSDGMLPLLCHGQASGRRELQTWETARPASGVIKRMATNA